MLPHKFKLFDPADILLGSLAFAFDRYDVYDIYYTVVARKVVQKMCVSACDKSGGYCGK